MRKRSRSEYQYLKGILNKFNAYSYRIINDKEKIEDDLDETKPLKSPTIVIELALPYDKSTKSIDMSSQCNSGLTTFIIIKLKEKDLQVVCADDILLDGMSIKDYYHYPLEELKEFLLIIHEKEKLV